MICYISSSSVKLNISFKNIPRTYIRYSGLLDNNECKNHSRSNNRKKVEFVVAATFYPCHFIRENKVPWIDDFFGLKTMTVGNHEKITAKSWLVVIPFLPAFGPVCIQNPWPSWWDHHTPFCKTISPCYSPWKQLSAFTWSPLFL